MEFQDPDGEVRDPSRGAQGGGSQEKKRRVKLGANFVQDPWKLGSRLTSEEEVWGPRTNKQTNN